MKQGVALPIVAVGLVSFVLFALVLLYAVVLRRSRLRQRLSIRIAALILMTGPAVLVGLLLFNAAFYGTIGQAAPWWSRLVQLMLVVLGTPLLLGLLAARYVTRPLSEFTRAIATLKDNDYRVRLQASGVHEFDRAFGQFNELLERLHEEEILRKNLISDTSHELNTPLAALIAQLEGMKSGVIKKDAAHIDTLLREAYRLDDTAAQLLDYARMQAHTMKPKVEEIPLPALLMELVHENEQLLHEASLVLESNISVPTIHADKTLLKQLLTNLIQNAARYSGGDTLKVSYDGQTLTVADNGRGVPTDKLPHIFERFYRVESSRSRDTGGLGLGLAIVKEIAEGHGWHITATDAAPGLTFIFDQTFTPSSHEPALMPTMKTKYITTKTAAALSNWRELSPWIAIALISLGLILFTYVSVQQNYRLSAENPQIQMAEDTAATWNAGTAPKALVPTTTVDAAHSLAPFTIIVDRSGNVLASDVQLNGITPLPPHGVFSDAQNRGELRFTWQTEGGHRFAAVVDPTPNGAVLTARSLRDAEQNVSHLTLLAGLTLLGVIGVLTLAYVVIAR